MSLRFYMDHNVPAAIPSQLRHRGIECLTAFEDGYARAPDANVLQGATDLNQILFSMDEDLLAVATHRIAHGPPFGGLVYGRQLHLTIGQAVRDLHLIAHALAEDEMIVYIPL